MSSNYYLATTGISSIWDLDRKLLFLGPWCTIGSKKDDIIGDKDYFIVDSPWKPAIKLKEASDYCHSIYKKTIPEISQKLNLIHNVSYPDRYWQILIGPWLYHFIEVVYERYKRIEQTLKLFPDFYTHVLPQQKCSLVFNDTYDFLSIKGKSTDDLFNLMLFSLIIDRLCPEKGLTIELRSENKTCKNAYSLKRKILGKLARLKFYLGHTDKILCDMYHFPFREILHLEREAKISFYDFALTKDSQLTKTLCFDSRKNITLGLTPSNAFEGLLYELIPKAMPLCYLENYNAYKDNVKSLNPIKIVGSAVGWYFNEEFKFFAAESFLKGAKLIYFQHGGGYGMSLSIPPEKISLEKDIFYTWGWTLNNENKTKPLPSPYLSNLKNSSSPQMDNILFVGNSTHKYISYLSSRFLPDDMPKYFKDKKTFFDSLESNIKNKMLYRPHNEIGWEEVDRVNRLLQGVRLVPDGRLTDWMKKVKLVVIDHFSTTFLEAMTIDVPCVCFWDYESNLVRPEVAHFFDSLRDVGILHGRPELAAKKVNSVYADPLSWWKNEDVQGVKNIFCQQFACTSKDWLEKWKIEFLDSPKE